MSVIGIDTTYFIGETAIPNIDNSAVTEFINNQIEKLEPKFLQEMFGYELYKQIVTNTSDARIQSLLNGAEYTDYNGKLQKWNGFKNATTKESCFAKYVYFYAYKKLSTQSSALGEFVSNQVEGAAPISPRKKLAEAWNSMRKDVYQCLNYLKANETVYPEWDMIDYHNALQTFQYVNPIF